MVSVCRELLAMAILVITSEARPQYHKKRDNYASTWNGGLWLMPTTHTMTDTDDSLRSGGIVFPESFDDEPSTGIYNRRAQQEDDIITEASVLISTSVRHQDNGDDGTSGEVPVHTPLLMQKMSFQSESLEVPSHGVRDVTLNQSAVTESASLISQNSGEKTMKNITSTSDTATLLKNPCSYESVSVPDKINNTSEHDHNHFVALSNSSDVLEDSDTQIQENFTEKSPSVQNISHKENITFNLYGRQIDNLTDLSKHFSEHKNQTRNDHDGIMTPLFHNSSRNYSGQDSTNYNTEISHKENITFTMYNRRQIDNLTDLPKDFSENIMIPSFDNSSSNHSGQDNFGNVSFHSSENNADEQIPLSTDDNLRKKERILTAWGVKWKIQWNKGPTTTQSPSSSGGSKIVFPGEMDFNSVVKYMPQVNNGQPPKCAGDNTFCESADLYPHDYLKRVLENEVNVPPQFFGNDLVDVNLRINPNDEVSLCPSMEEIVYPKVAQNKEDKWLFVVNQDSYTQGIRIEKCGKQEACRFADNFPLGFVTSCQQKYIYRKLLALGEDGKPTSDSFRLPSCCSCVVSKAYPSGRMADAGGKPQTPAATRRRKRR